MTESTKLAGVLGAWLTCVMPALTGLLGAEESFDYFQNSWSLIGLKDYAQATRVTPENELLVKNADGKDVKVRICYGRQLSPLSRTQTKRLLDGWLPVILITSQDESVRYDFTLWATPLPTVRDWQRAFDGPSEGENFLNWVRVKVTNAGDATADAKLKIEGGSPAPGRSRDFAWSLAPGQSVEAVVRLPFSSLEGDPDFAGEDAALWLDRTVRYWRGVLGRGTQIEVPCRKATEAYPASHVCQLINADHGELHPGEGFYDQFYIRDAAYQLMSLEEAGLSDAARTAVAGFLSRQRPDGRFESQKGQLDANGQACWALWQYYRVTGDRPWLTAVYPQMRRAADWTMQARRQGPADSPFAGVLPNALADGEYLWGGKHHIVGYDFWNLRGLLCTAEAARVLGRTQEAQELTHEAELYRAAIDAAWAGTGLAHFPPSWEKEGTHWGNTETLWPTELFDRDDKRVAALIQAVRNDHGGGFVEGTIRWLGQPDAIHPYMSAYTTMASLLCGDHQEVVEDFYWYLLHSTATHAFPEGIFYQKRLAWSDTIPHALGASNYALLLRHMLVHERSAELHLLMAVPDWWLSEGQVIRVERAPTHFGPVSLRVAGTATGVEVRFDPRWREPPRRIVLHLPESRPLAVAVTGMDVAVRSQQKNRWDLPTVIRLYRERAGLSAEGSSPTAMPPATSPRNLSR
ncbi:MAG: hypothetical protein MUC88_05230 [Planctomycetes bacterium]|nr:hypothetical protein [Planctomycetota bacterium]